MLLCEQSNGTPITKFCCRYPCVGSAGNKAPKSGRWQQWQIRRRLSGPVRTSGWPLVRTIIAIHEQAVKRGPHLTVALSLPHTEGHCNRGTGIIALWLESRWCLSHTCVSLCLADVSHQPWTDSAYRQLSITALSTDMTFARNMVSGAPTDHRTMCAMHWR